MPDIELRGNLLNTLTPNAAQYFNERILAFATRLKLEAEDTARQRIGSGGTLQITDQDVMRAMDNAFRNWLRRPPSIWYYILRVSQLVATAAIGLGASNTGELWGWPLVGFGLFSGVSLLATELFITRGRT